MATQDRPLAIYIHIPFCARHCAYCDFNTYVEKSKASIVSATVDAICQDIEQSASELMATEPSKRWVVPTIFFGGGTPTFLSGRELARILGTIQNCFAVADDAEISSEANPGSSDASKFYLMHEAGFNRLSIGVQSFNDDLLIKLDRFHTSCEAEKAFVAARSAGFENVSLDLMFGLPGQTSALWESSMERAISLEPEHLSLYALTLEPGTRFERLAAGGKLDLPDEDVELAMYERSIDALSAAGLEHYEVSNFAKPGFRSRHNQIYWRNEEYLGFGPGAVSYLDGRRWKRERLPQKYVGKLAMNMDIAVESEHIDLYGALGETMMLGLRLRDGLPLQRVRKRFSIDPLTHFADQIARLQERGLLVVEGDTLRLSHAGLLLANDALSEFLPD